MGEDLRRPLIGAHHGDHPAERRLVELLTAFDEHHQFLEEASHPFSIGAAHDDFVAPDLNHCVGKGGLDGAQIRVTSAAQGGEQVLAGHHDPDQGIGRCHSGRFMSGQDRRRRGVPSRNGSG